MPRSWEAFPAIPWPKYFGLRERPARAQGADIDQLEFDLLADVDGVHAASRAARHACSPLEQLRAVLTRSKLSQEAFAQWVLGCAGFTLSRWLRGDRIPECRRPFLSRLESATVHGDRILIVIRAGTQVLPRWRPPRSWT